MSWLDFVENPGAITSIFTSVPSLDEVEVTLIKADQDGPTIELTVALKEYPSSPPQRWHREANAVTLSLQLMGTQSVELQGWTTTNRAKITIERSQSAALRVLVTGPVLKLNANCDFVRIAHVSAYRREVLST